MANPYFIKIELPSETKESAVASTGAGSTGGEQENESSSPDMAVKAVKKLVSYATIKGTADSLISNHISQVALETGATEYEQRANMIHSIGSQVMNTAFTVGMGIATGNWPLALVGLVTSGISTAINISAKEKQLQTKQELEDISIGMQNVRAGTSGRRSREQ